MLAYICLGNVKKEVNIISQDKGKTNHKTPPSQPFQSAAWVIWDWVYYLIILDTNFLQCNMRVSYDVSITHSNSYILKFYKGGHLIVCET